MRLETGVPLMGKQGRSVQLPPDVYMFAEAYEAGTGVKFNRLILAAFLKLIFDEFSFSNKEWIAFAYAVEQGTMRIEDLPLVLAHLTTEYYEEEIKRRKKGLRRIYNIGDDEVRRRVDEAKGVLCEWETRMEDYTDARNALLGKLKGPMIFKMGEESESKD